MQNDEDVNCLFESFKQAAGNFNNLDVMNYDEFIKGILDFPFLLKQLKQEILSNQDTFDQKSWLIDYAPDSARSNDSYSMYDSITRVSIDTITSPDYTVSLGLYNSLKRILQLLDKAARTNSHKISETDTLGELTTSGKESLDSLFEAMFYELKLIENRFKSSGNESILTDPRIASNINTDTIILLIKSCKVVITTLKENNGQWEEIVKELKSRLEVSRYNLDNMKQRTEVLERSKVKMLHKLNDLEKSTQSTEHEHREVLAEKNALKAKLFAVEQEGLETKDEISSIQTVIRGKEDVIFNLQREVRRLTSLKTIQEMKSTKLSPQMIHDIKAQQVERSTLPLSGYDVFHSPRQTTIPGHIDEDTITSMRSLIKAQKEKINKLSDELKLKSKQLDETEFDMKREIDLLEDEHIRQIQSLKDQNLDLYRLLKQERLKNNELRNISPRPSRHSAGHSLYDELKFLRTPYSTTDQPSAIESKVFDKEVQANFIAIPLKIIESLDSNTPKPAKERCCGWSYW